MDDKVASRVAAAEGDVLSDAPLEKLTCAERVPLGDCDGDTDAREERDTEELGVLDSDTRGERLALGVELVLGEDVGECVAALDALVDAVTVPLVLTVPHRVADVEARGVKLAVSDGKEGKDVGLDVLLPLTAELSDTLSDPHAESETTALCEPLRDSGAEPVPMVEDGDALIPALWLTETLQIGRAHV